jgi:polyhydroxybutyrate depolymerase
VGLLGVPAACADADTSSGASEFDAGAATDGTSGAAETSGDGDVTDGGDGDGDGDGDGMGSPGCSLVPTVALGGVQLEIDAGTSGDGQRSYFLTLPDDYDPSVPHRVVIGYAGTDWTGEMIRPYLELEASSPSAPTIFVYPDPLWRDFPGWGVLGGWVLGPNAAPADGNGDLAFTEALLDHLEATYCVDSSRVFATGHSWGGDMAHVAACFLGDRITAAVPIAANRPYWFDTAGGWQACTGTAAVWTMFGQDDTHFTSQPYPGAYGDECDAFWFDTHGCPDVNDYDAIPLGDGMECIEYRNCATPTLYCLYGAEFGHQKPDYFASAALAFFDRF